MGALSKKLRSIEGGCVGFWCPGCDCVHIIGVTREKGPNWTWDVNKEAPTFSPSILVTGRVWNGTAHVEERCHTFVRAGIIEFLGDCTHKLAGQKMPIPDWPYAEGEYGGV